MKSFVLLFAGITITFLFNGCTSYKTVKTPDGKEVYAFENKSKSRNIFSTLSKENLEYGSLICQEKFANKINISDQNKHYSVKSVFYDSKNPKIIGVGCILNINGIPEKEYNTFNNQGFNSIGFDKDGFDINGFNIDGFDRNGYDKQGFNAENIHKQTKTNFNPDGYDIKGYDKNGIDKNGFNRDRVDNDRYDKDGFNPKGIHKLTQTEYDPNGFNKSGIHKDTGTPYNVDGYNYKGQKLHIKKEFTAISQKSNIEPIVLDKFGFNEQDIHKQTGSKLNQYGMTKESMHAAKKKCEEELHGKYSYDAKSDSHACIYNLKIVYLHNL